MRRLTPLFVSYSDFDPHFSLRSAASDCIQMRRIVLVWVKHIRYVSAWHLSYRPNRRLYIYVCKSLHRSRYFISPQLTTIITLNARVQLVAYSAVRGLRSGCGVSIRPHCEVASISYHHQRRTDTPHWYSVVLARAWMHNAGRFIENCSRSG